MTSMNESMKLKIPGLIMEYQNIWHHHVGKQGLKKHDGFPWDYRKATHTMPQNSNLVLYTQSNVKPEI